MPSAAQTHKRISSAAVAKATGKSWDEWRALLDAAGAEKMTHQEIVRVVHANGVGPWWQQMVTVGYEFARGKRVLGQTKTVGFEVGVQRTFAVSPARAWSILAGRPFRDVWLGALNRFDFAEGSSFVTDEGTRGEIRSLTPGKKVRLTWQPARRKSPTTLQIYVLPSGRGASIRIHHEKLASEAERRRLRKHWQNVLEQFPAAKGE